MCVGVPVSTPGSRPHWEDSRVRFITVRRHKAESVQGKGLGQSPQESRCRLLEPSLRGVTQDPLHPLAMSCNKTCGVLSPGKSTGDSSPRFLWGAAYACHLANAGRPGEKQVVVTDRESLLSITGTGSPPETQVPRHQLRTNLASRPFHLEQPQARRVHSFLLKMELNLPDSKTYCNTVLMS